MTTADDFLIDTSYPGDAAAGCCYLTLADLGTIVENHDGVDVVRPERVIVTPIEVPYEGRVCLSERIVRHLAHKLGMVDQWRVDEARAEWERTVAENRELSEQVVRGLETVRLLKELEADAPEQLYVAVDGTTHASLTAARLASAESLGLELADTQIPAISADEAPVPAPSREAQLT